MKQSLQITVCQERRLSACAIRFNGRRFRWVPHPPDGGGAALRPEIESRNGTMHLFAVKRARLALFSIVSLTACSQHPGTPADHVYNNPSLKPPVPIVTPYGNTITCQAGVGAVCVQR